MKKVTIVISLLFLTVLGFAQAPKLNITGTVKDFNTKATIEYTTAVLVNGVDSIQAAITMTNKAGAFKFTNVGRGNFFIQFSIFGYHLKNSEMIEISAAKLAALGSDTLHLGDIYLQPQSNKIEEVVVRAKKPMIEQEPGKLVVNVESYDIIKLADNAFEMLKKVPGVYIDNSDNISLNGKSGVLVTIDDRPTYLSGAELAAYLKSMSPENVVKIEAMDNPSAKYDAAGGGGVINIVTLTGRNIGFSGSVRADAGVKFTDTENPKFATTESLNLSYRGKVATIYGNLSGNFANDNNDMYSYARNANGIVTEYNGNDNERWMIENNSRYLSGKIGTDLYLSKNDILSFSYSGNNYGSSSSQLTNIRNSFNDSIFSSIAQRHSGDYVWQNHHANMNYEHKFDSVYNRKMYLDFNWIRSGTTSESYNGIHNYTGDFMMANDSMHYQQTAPLYTDVFSINADYSHPFKNKVSKLDVGVKFSASLSDNDLIYVRNDIFDSTRSNRFIYNEMIGAAYASFSHSFKTKTHLNVGVRYETTNTMGDNRTIDSVNQNFYSRPFPNVSVSQQIGNFHNLSLSYRHGVSRPGYSQLNPFLTQEDVRSFRAGNPYLEPSYNNNFTLGYSYKYKLFLNAGYTNATGQVGDFTFYNDDNIATSIYKNLGNTHNYFLSANYQQTFFKIWQIMLYINGSYSISNTEYLVDGVQQEVQENGYNVGMWISNSVQILPTLTFEASAWISPPNKNLFTTTEGMYFVNASIKKTFYKNKLSVGLYLDDILGSSYGMEAIYPDGSIAQTQYRWNGRTAKISVSYKFGNNKNMERNQRSTRSIDESSRMGGGTGSGAGAGGGR